MPFPDIPLCRSGYSRNLNGEAKVTDFETHQRMRRSCRRRGCTDTLCWVCDREQCQALAVFHRQQGSHWFNLCLPDCDGLTTTVVRFSGPLTIKPVAGLFEITARVHIPDPRVLPKEDLEDRLLALIGIRDGSFNNPLHLFISTWSSLLSGGHHEY